MNEKEVFLRLLKSNVKKYLNKLIFALILSIIVAASTSATAWLLDPAVKKIFLDQDMSMLYIIPIGIITAFSAKGISLYFARAITIRVGIDVKSDLQEEMAKTILKSDTQKIEDKHSGKFISNFIYDAGMIVDLVSRALLNLMKESFTLIGLLCLMFYQNWRLALFALLLMPVAGYVSRTLGKRMGKVSKETQEITANLSTYLSEILKSSKLIKIYQQEKFEIQRSRNLILLLAEKLKKMGIIQIRATPIMEIFTGFIIGGFIYYSGYLVINGQLEINSFFSFLAAMMLAYQPVKALAQIHIGINQGLAAAKRVYEVIDTEIKIKDKENSTKLSIKKAKIEFNNVSFSYPNSKRSAVKNINMNIDGGSIVALVGHSGAGKSTVFNLLPRFYDMSQGNVYIDDQSINDVSLDSLRKNISLVSQDIVLFDDTVYSNIAYANVLASKEQIIAVTKLAAAKNFIEELPQKYDTVIGENGVKLSGGQKQRLSIARALLKDSPIILLDEATSSLDAESESQVQNAIMNLTKNKTTLVIAHRLSTIMRADKIFVFNNGEIVDFGKHEELLNKSVVYRNLYDKQIESTK